MAVDEEQVRKLAKSINPSTHKPYSTRDIGKIVGCSHARVAQILETKEDAERRKAKDYQRRRQKALLNAIVKLQERGSDPLTPFNRERIKREIKADPDFAELVEAALKWESS